MAEWHDWTPDKDECETLLIEGQWRTSAGVFTLILDLVSGEYYRVRIPEVSGEEIQATTLGAAQAAALSWARGVLGVALVEAGAEMLTMFICDKCDIISNSPGPCDCGNLKPVQFVRIE